MTQTMIRFLPVAFLALLAACGAPDPLEEDLPPMGDFSLMHNVVFADNMRQVPPSRNATPDEWESIIQSEVNRRFAGYTGENTYHFGIAVDGYALAVPGIPVVATPRSILVISVTVWDEQQGIKLNDEPEQFYIFEGASPETFLVGSGIARTREQQMQGLARNAERRIQLWLLENPQWFGIDPNAAATAAATVEAVVNETGGALDQDAAQAIAASQ
jgi:hypothetical protein